MSCQQKPNTENGQSSLYRCNDTVSIILGHKVLDFGGGRISEGVSADEVRGYIVSCCVY